MAKRWSAEDINDLWNLAREHSVQAIRMDRTVGGVAFKAHQLGVALKSRSQAADRGVMEFDWANYNQPLPDKVHSG